MYTRLDKFYVNKDIYNFKKDVNGVITKVKLYTLLDYFPITIDVFLVGRSPNPRNMMCFHSTLTF